MSGNNHVRPRPSLRSGRATLLSRFVLMICAALLPAAFVGCNQSSKSPAGGAADRAAGQPGPAVTVVKPERTTLRRAVRQPGYVQAFEQTAVFARIAGYVKKWNVDMGDRVKKDQVLAELWVPEMVAELKQKEEMVKQAQEAYEVAKARVVSAAAFVQEMKAGVQRAEANRDHWQRQHDRISKLTAGAVIDAQTRDETENQLHAAAAGAKEAAAKVGSAEAALKESEAMRNKAQVDIGAAEADRDRMAALVSYAQLIAPYDGVVTRRTINTGDFVQPATGAKGEPLYVVERRDLVRVLVEVPELDASWVHKGSKAQIRVQVIAGHDLESTVARTSYALDRTTRTLIAEIDVENPKDLLRPNMYAFATITGELPDVLSLPAAAILTQGDVLQGYQNYCFLVRDGKVWKTPVQLGARGGDRVEVLKKQLKPAKAGAPAEWESFTGNERIVQGNLGTIADGQAVNP